MHHCEHFLDLWVKKKGFLFDIFLLCLPGAVSIVVWNPHGNVLISDQKFGSTFDDRLLNSVRLPTKFIDMLTANKWERKAPPKQKSTQQQTTIKLDIWLKVNKQKKTAA